MALHRSGVIAGVVVAAAALLASCKDDAKPRLEPFAKSLDFWPEAPGPTGTGGPRALTYNADNINGYKISMDITTPPGSRVSIAAKIQVALGFRAGTAPRSREAHIHSIDYSITGAGQDMEVHLDGEQMTARSGSGRPVTRRRGEGGPVDLAAMTEQPFTTLRFTEANAVEIETNRAHPMVKFGGDLLDNALVVFPDLPREPVAPGYQWTIMRNVPLAQNLGRVDVTYNFEYAGDGRCPSGAKSCAQLAVIASSKEVEVQVKGVKTNVSYRFAGRVFLDLDSGRVDESRLRMDVEAKFDSGTLTMRGVYIIKPT